jgi:hypothetical protein
VPKKNRWCWEKRGIQEEMERLVSRKSPRAVIGVLECGYRFLHLYDCDIHKTKADRFFTNLVIRKAL